MNKDEENNLLDLLSSILVRCLFFSFALLFLWGAIYFLGGDLIYGVHSKWFEMSRHEYDLLNYYGMAFTKIFAILFFLFPYLSIRLVLGKKKKDA